MKPSCPKGYMSDKILPHLGIEFAEYRANVDSDAKDIDIITSWARDTIRNRGISIGTEDYDAIMHAIDGIIDDTAERQLYLRTIFLEAKEQ